MVDILPAETNSIAESRRRPWRRFFSLLWLLFVVGLISFFVINKRHELSDLGDILGSADRRWIVVAGVVELVILFLMTRTYQVILATLGQRVPLHSITASYLKGLAVGTVVPFGGPAAIVVFIRSLTQSGVPANDAVFASTLASLSGFASFLLMLVVVIVSLFLAGQLPAIVVGATLVLAVIFLFAAGAVVIPLRWKRIPGWVTRYLPGWAVRFLVEAHDHHIHVRDLRRPFLYSVGVDVCGGIMLYAALLSVGERTQILAAFSAYQVEMLFNVVTPLFQGIGIADLSITVALHQLGVNITKATAATLVYRLWDLWIPLLAGALVSLFGRRFGRKRASVG